MRDEVGYSLVELLSVTAVLAIVMAIAVPNLSRAQRHYQLQAAAQRIAQAVQEAKLDAVGKSAARKIVFNTANHSLTTSHGTVVAMPTGIRFAALPSGVTAPPVIQAATANSATLLQQQSDAKSAVSLPQGNSSELRELNITGRGLPAVEPGVVHWIYLVNQEEQRLAVTISSIGSVAVLQWKGNQWQ